MTVRWKSLRDGRKMFVLQLGSKTLRFRPGSYSNHQLVPFRESGPFGCFLLSWRWGQIEWSLTRWT